MDDNDLLWGLFAVWYDARENYHRSEIHRWARSARHCRIRARELRENTLVGCCSAKATDMPSVYFSLHAINGRECSKWDFLLFYLCDCNESITVIFLFDKQITRESRDSVSELCFPKIPCFLSYIFWAFSRIIALGYKSHIIHSNVGFIIRWVRIFLPIANNIERNTIPHSYCYCKEKSIREFDTLFCQ